MCHSSCVKFGEKVIRKEDVQGKSVLEVGSLNVNGSLRSLLETYAPSEYVGIDLKKGPGVDVICDANDIVQYFGKERFNLILATELLEHVADWRSTIRNFKHALKPEGVLLITTRSKGFRVHGYPFDFWRFEVSDMETIFSDFDIEVLENDPSYPGVFLKARKRPIFNECNISKHKLYSVVKDRPVESIRILDFYVFRLCNIVRRVLSKCFKR